jgi:hypothetical protein
MTINYYPRFIHPTFGSVGDHLCKSCAGERTISEPSPMTKCDNSHTPTKESN